jgi:predicted nucleic acid-binding protein
VTRFVVDSTVVIHLVSEGIDIAAGHELVAPTLIRSQVLSSLHESVARGELDSKAGLALLRAAWRLPIRLLGDAVLRRRAWDLATTLGWDETYAAEYVALTQLQGDAFVTLDEELAKAASAMVSVATVDDLRRPAST